jgi:HKD family nuclease
MFSFGRQQPVKNASVEQIESKLFDELSFYQTFLQDLRDCEEEVVIESPFITYQRAKIFDRIFKNLIKKGVKISVITRDPREHEEFMEIQSEEAIQYFESIGVQVLICAGNHHRKLAILDKQVLWEGSLNILSQTRSREIMRRINNKTWAVEMFDFLKLERFI